MKLRKFLLRCAGRRRGLRSPSLGPPCAPRPSPLARPRSGSLARLLRPPLSSALLPAPVPISRLGGAL